MTRTAILIALLALFSAPAFAQRDPNGPDPSKVKVRLGPIIMNPNVSFGKIGVDENVFNEPTDPKRDFTLTISPRTEIYLRFLGTWFTGKMNEDIVWYQHYPSERQGNTTYGLDWKWPLTRLTVNTTTSHATTRERPGFEIDERAQRTVNAFGAGASFRMFINTGFEFKMRRDTTSYDETVTFKGVNLRDQLDVITSTMSVGVNHRITSLTSATLDFSRVQDRFPFNPFRDADTTEVQLSVRFDAQAVLKGSFSVGYTDYQPLYDPIPSYTGAILAADLTYTLAEITRFTLKADRGVQDSFDIKQPYYVQTGFNFGISQQLLPKLDVVARVGLENMAYRDRTDAPVDFGNRTDRLVTYGIGVGYHRGKNMRLGLDYDMVRRDSIDGSREYQRPQIGTSVTYDF